MPCAWWKGVRMAQTIITLAKQETSEEILEKVNNIKTVVDGLIIKTTAISDAQQVGGANS